MYPRNSLANEDEGRRIVNGGAGRRIAIEGLGFGHLSTDSRGVTVHASTSDDAPARCPVCQRPSSRTHSRYARTVHDLPWRGVRVAIRVRARRFFCDNAGCERAIFCERLPEIAPRARETDRLEEALLAIVLELGGRAGARLAEELGLVVGRDALLRRAKSFPLPDSGKVRVLGVDDFAFRKGQPDVHPGACTRVTWPCSVPARSCPRIPR